MISGYNTDVPHEDVVFHVQTEDKGKATAWIETLVYVGGEILARRRSSYKRVLERGLGEEAIVRLMERQHRGLIAEIRQGLIGRRETGEQAEQGAEPERRDAMGTAPDEPGERREEGWEAASEELEPADLSLDQVILEFLSSRKQQDELILTVDASSELGLGHNVELTFRTTSRLTRQPVPGARVVVRMISTVAQPLDLAKGETGEDGELVLSFRIPQLQRGSGALIIGARSDLGAAEMKHLL